MTGETKDKGAPPPAGAKGSPARWIGLGVGAGIGSAAIAAALLYATRAGGRKGEREPR